MVAQSTIGSTLLREQAAKSAAESHRHEFPGDFVYEFVETGPADKFEFGISIKRAASQIRGSPWRQRSRATHLRARLRRLRYATHPPGKDPNVGSRREMEAILVLVRPLRISENGLPDTDLWSCNVMCDRGAPAESSDPPVALFKLRPTWIAGLYEGDPSLIHLGRQIHWCAGTGYLLSRTCHELLKDERYFEAVGSAQAALASTGLPFEFVEVRIERCIGGMLGNAASRDAIEVVGLHRAQDFSGSCSIAASQKRIAVASFGTRLKPCVFHETSDIIVRDALDASVRNDVQTHLIAIRSDENRNTCGALRPVPLKRGQRRLGKNVAIDDGAEREEIPRSHSQRSAERRVIRQSGECRHAVRDWHRCQ